MPDPKTKFALSTAQWLALLSCFIVTAYGVIGLFVNPDFAIGDATSSELVLGPALGLFYFPNPTGDALLHLVTGSIFLAGTVLAFRSRGSALAA